MLLGASLAGLDGVKRLLHPPKRVQARPSLLENLKLYKRSAPGRLELSTANPVAVVLDSPCLETSE